MQRTIVSRWEAKAGLPVRRPRKPRIARDRLQGRSGCLAEGEDRQRTIEPDRIRSRIFGRPALSSGHPGSGHDGGGDLAGEKKSGYSDLEQGLRRSAPVYGAARYPPGDIVESEWAPAGLLRVWRGANPHYFERIGASNRSDTHPWRSEISTATRTWRLSLPGIVGRSGRSMGGHPPRSGSSQRLQSRLYELVADNLFRPDAVRMGEGGLSIHGDGHRQYRRPAGPRDRPGHRPQSVGIPLRPGKGEIRMIASRSSFLDGPRPISARSRSRPRRRRRGRDPGDGS